MANEFKIKTGLLLGIDVSTKAVVSIQNVSTAIVADASSILVTGKAIYDFVQPLITTVLNASNNRILTSTGTSGGIYAESNVTYDGSTFTVNGSTGVVFDVNGNAGDLFTVTDTLTGVIFQVGDISGIPIFQVNSNGAVYINSAALAGLTTGTTAVLSIDASSGTACYYDYRVSNLGTNAYRSGTVMAVWNTSIGAVTWTDTSTPDLTATTVPFSFTVTLSGGNIVLNSVITTGTWSLKVGARVL